MQRAILIHQQLARQPDVREDGSFEHAGRRYTRLEACARELGIHEPALRQLLSPEARRGREAFVVRYFALNGTRYFDFRLVEVLVRRVPPGRDPAGRRMLSRAADDDLGADIPGLTQIGVPMFIAPGTGGLRPVKAEDLVEFPELKTFVNFGKTTGRRERPPPRPPVEMDADRLAASLWLALPNAASGQRYFLKRRARTVAVLGPVDANTPDVVRTVSRAVFERRLPHYLERAERGEPWVVRVTPWMANDFALLASVSTGS